MICICMHVIYARTTACGNACEFVHASMYIRMYMCIYGPSLWGFSRKHAILHVYTRIRAYSYVCLCVKTHVACAYMHISACVRTNSLMTTFGGCLTCKIFCKGCDRSTLSHLLIYARAISCSTPLRSEPESIDEMNDSSLPGASPFFFPPCYACFVCVCYA